MSIIDTGKPLLFLVESLTHYGWGIGAEYGKRSKVKMERFFASQAKGSARWALDKVSGL
jgi:hypothetical protein